MIYIGFLGFAKGQLQINWQNCFGGSQNDDAFDVLLANNGIYIIGQTQSNDGDISFSHGSLDGWLIKTDAFGDFLWEKTFGGSSGDAFYRGFLEQQNGNLFLIGSSTSNDGDISNDPYSESTDYWLVKVDSIGNIIWDKILGGNRLDQVTTGVATDDGGVIVLGYTGSEDGDINTYYGYYDWWLTKVNEDGNSEWETTIGDIDFDFPEAIIQTSDGGFLVGGTSKIRHEGNIQCDPYNDLAEGVIFKLDSDGNEEWQQCYGGSDNDFVLGLLELNDGYLLSCMGQSNDGDLVGSGWHGDHDIWVIRTDLFGNIIWQKCYGGSEYDDARNIFQTVDGNFVLFGRTRSFDGDVVGNHSLTNLRSTIWVICIDPSGELLWQQCIGGIANEDLEFGVKQKNDNTYVVAGSMVYSPSYDVDCNNHVNNGKTDYWLFELEDTTVGLSKNNIDEDDLSIYPNPANTQLYIELGSSNSLQDTQLEIINESGIIMMKTNLESNKSAINISQLHRGVYFIRVYFDQNTIVKKLVVF